MWSDRGPGQGLRVKLNISLLDSKNIWLVSASHPPVKLNPAMSQTGGGRKQNSVSSLSISEIFSSYSDLPLSVSDSLQIKITGIWSFWDNFWKTISWELTQLREICWFNSFSIKITSKLQIKAKICAVNEYSRNLCPGGSLAARLEMRIWVYNLFNTTIYLLYTPVRY